MSATKTTAPISPSMPSTPTMLSQDRNDHTPNAETTMWHDAHPQLKMISHEDARPFIIDMTHASMPQGEKPISDIVMPQHSSPRAKRCRMFVEEMEDLKHIRVMHNSFASISWLLADHIGTRITNNDGNDADGILSLSAFGPLSFLLGSVCHTRVWKASFMIGLYAKRFEAERCSDFVDDKKTFLPEGERRSHSEYAPLPEWRWSLTPPRSSWETALLATVAGIILTLGLPTLLPEGALLTGAIAQTPEEKRTTRLGPSSPEL